MAKHLEARQLASDALVEVFPEQEITGGEIRALAGVAYLETQYGRGWRGPGKGSNNMGAIQAHKNWAGARFSYIDTHPNADGSSTPYRIDFRAYPTPLEGWIDLAKVAYVNRGRVSVREAAREDDLLGVSKALHDTGYYEGFGRTVADRIRHHFRALSRAVSLADAAVLASDLDREIPPDVKAGEHGEHVKLMQAELQVPRTGVYDIATDDALRAYQKAHGLKPDGWCGQLTWTALFTDDFVP